MSFEKQMYEVKEKWEESYFSPQDKRRVEFVQSIIPADAKSILDVGCGNGILINYLAQEHSSDFDRICGADRSKTSLSFVKTEKFESDIDKLPFKDNEFDVVTCLEVIEHLPQKVYQKALNKIQRIAKKYIIISVPYKEDLDYSKIACTKCRTEFNPFYHMHSFDDEKVTNLYSDNKKVKFKELHKMETSMRPRFRYLKKSVSKIINGNQFSNVCICPMCGYNEFDELKQKNNKATRKDEIVYRPTGLSRFWPHYKESKWIAGFFTKH